jgi:hypothetical protein
MGATKLIPTPEDMLSLWDEYKKHIDSKPDEIQRATNQGIQTEKVKRPYTRMGFQAYVYRQRGHHVSQYIDNNDNAYSEFLGVITCMRNEWEDDQVSGSLTGRYKAPNLVARLNGLTETTKTELTGNLPTSVTFNFTDMSGDKTDEDA